MKRRLTGLYRYCTVAGAASALWSGNAAAASGDQVAQAAPQTAQAPAIEEVVVTATRIVRDGFEAPTPTSVLGPAELEQAAVTNVADFVNQLPSVVGSQTPRSQISGVSSGTTGINAIALRGLGGTRTLILLDGERLPASQLGGLVDANEFPQSLISRVDVVTGGASASWGSDALAGVVNFVLDKNYTGLKGEVEGGVTTYGDDRNWKLSLTGGTGFANERGHFLVSGEATYQDGIQLATARPWYTGIKQLANPAYTATNGLPQFLIRYGVGFSTTAPGLIITAGPLKGIIFGPNGTPSQFNYGSIVSPPVMVGGDWKATDFSQEGALDTEMSRRSIFARASYDIADNVNVYVQASYGTTSTFENETSYYSFGNLTISSQNPFIPASVKSQMTALGLTNFTGGTSGADMGYTTGSTRRQIYRYIVGANGKFDAFDSPWSWNVAAYSGHSIIFDIATTPNQTKFRQAIDVVSGANGVPVCRTTVTTPNDGCVPFNILGTGVNSQAAINYVLGYPTLKQFINQRVVDGSVNGTPFSNWAGPVSLAFGASYRKESAYGGNDPLAGQYFVGNYRASTGAFSVTEGFVETVVPIAENTLWAKSFELNAAVRATSYTTSGYVTTWKIGGTYKPIDDITFRATRSRDIRAPNLQEGFSAGQASTATLQDPFRANASTVYISTTTGNLALNPEKADTTGLGLVVQPSFLPGFSASVDYYNIAIDGSIASLSAQNVVNNCYLGNAPSCGEIVRNSAGIITNVNIYPINLVAQTARGLDFEASYRTQMASLVDSWDGSLTVRFFATRFLKNYSNNGLNPPIDSVGTNSGGGPPKLRTMSSITYDNQSVTLSASFRTLSAGAYNNAYVVCTSGCPVSTVNNPTYESNHIDGTYYVDTSFTYKVTDTVQSYLTISNLLNKAPAPVGSGTGLGTQIGVNPTLYDVIGRAFRLGIRFKM